MFLDMWSTDQQKTVLNVFDSNNVTSIQTNNQERKCCCQVMITYSLNNMDTMAIYNSAGWWRWKYRPQSHIAGSQWEKDNEKRGIPLFFSVFLSDTSRGLSLHTCPQADRLHSLLPSEPGLSRSWEESTVELSTQHVCNIQMDNIKI